jgi:hypothetical protein
MSIGNVNLFFLMAGLTLREVQTIAMMLNMSSTSVIRPSPTNSRVPRSQSGEYLLFLAIVLTVGVTCGEL